MIVTVFRSKLDEQHKDAYKALTANMTKLVTDMPGLVSYKSFKSHDGERVIIVEFKDEESHNAWRDHPQHRRAMELGKARFYESYKVQVCRLMRDVSFSRDEVE